MRERGTRVLSRARMTDGIDTRSLTPVRALAYLRELSVDVRAAVVLDAAGERLAGDAELVERARGTLAASDMPATGTRLVPSEAETFAVVRGTAGAVIAVLAGPQALVPLLLHDVEAILGDLA